MVRETKRTWDIVHLSLRSVFLSIFSSLKWQGGELPRNEGAGGNHDDTIGALDVFVGKRSWSNCKIDVGSYLGPLPWTFWEHDGHLANVQAHTHCTFSYTTWHPTHLAQLAGFALVLCYGLSQKAAVVASMREGIFSRKPPCQCPFSIIWYSYSHCCLKSSRAGSSTSRTISLIHTSWICGTSFDFGILLQIAIHNTVSGSRIQAIWKDLRKDRLPVIQLLQFLLCHRSCSSAS